MSKIIDGWNEKPVNKITLYPGSRAWMHRFGLQNGIPEEEGLNGYIHPGFSYSYTVNTSSTTAITISGQKR